MGGAENESTVKQGFYEEVEASQEMVMYFTEIRKTLAGILSVFLSFFFFCLLGFCTSFLFFFNLVY